MSAALAVFTACGGGGGGGGNTVTADVYVGGYEIGANNVRLGMVWKNGETYRRIGDGVRGSYVYSVYVDGSNVYAVGQESQGVGTYFQATLWKNNDASVRLAPTYLSSSAESVYVSGGTVYVAGYVWTSSGAGPYAVLWTNGTMRFLHGTSNRSEASSVFVSGGNVYVAGTDAPSSGLGYDAIVWRNSEAGRYLSTSAGMFWYWSEANSIYVSGNDIYVAGLEDDGDLNAVYWKTTWANISSTPATRLAYAAYGSVAESIYVSGSNVYVAGWSWSAATGNRPHLWNNGATVPISYSGNSFLNSVFVKGAVVYTAGYESRSSCVWMNNTILHRMPSSVSGYQSEGTSVFVK